MMIKHFAILFALFALQGCVGEVQNAARDTTISSTEAPKSDIEFQGIIEAIPISDDKVEVYFYSATKGSQKYTYLIYLGNEPNPISVTEEVLAKDYRGLYRYTISGLDIGTQYHIKVDVKDKEDGVVVTTKTSKSVYTFSNYVADFSGISEVGNVQGVQGLDSINVRWAHAAIPGGIFTLGDKPDSYEIIIIDSSKLTPAAIDDESLESSDGRIVRTIQYDPLVTETMVRGLKEDTLFYVAVRCLHEGSIEDPTAPQLRGEKNHNYMQIKTLTQDAASIEYDPSEFVLNNNSGSLATSSFLANWGQFIGVFDHFRLYYARKPNLALVTSSCVQGGGPDLLGGSTFCKKMSVDQTSTMVGDLPPQIDFQAQLLACLTAYCEDFIALPIREIKTATTLASFTGLSFIELANDLSEIGSVSLYYPPVNFATGYFDGLAVEFTTEKTDLNSYLNGSGSMPQSYLVHEEFHNDHDLTHDYFDYEVADKIVVRGINYTEEKDYCFSIYPFNFDPSGPDGKVYYKDNMVWQCKKVEVEAPTSDEFAGLNEPYSVDNDIALNWNPPSRGIYSHFEIFHRKAIDVNDKNFSFYQAIEDTTVYFDETNYQRTLLSSYAGLDANGAPITLTTHTLQNVPNGYYLIGVLTYINAGVGASYRSEENTAVFQCEVTGSSAPVNCVKI